jgi:hypothetical protein
MKRLPLLTLLAAMIAAPVHAQTTPAATGADASKTRQQVKIERDEFLRSHTWNADHDEWVLKPEFETPEGVKSRAEVKAERDRFLGKYQWDAATESWVAVSSGPRDISTLDREQVRLETREFVRTHEWDSWKQEWVLKAVPTPRRAARP